MDWITGKRDDTRKIIAQLGNPAMRSAAASELLHIGPAAVDGLVEVMGGRDLNLRAPAAQVLVRMGTTAIPRLSQLLTSAHPEIRQQIADALGDIHHPDALPALMEATRGQFFTVRARAASALAKIGDAQAIQILISLLSDNEPSVRIAAALAVGSFRDKSSLIRLSDLLLEDREIEVRQAAAQGLAATGLPEAVPYLIEAMADSFWWYERENAAQPLLEALESFGADAVEPLINALTHPEGTVRRSAAQVLGSIGDRRAVEPLGMALYDLHIEMGQAAAEALVGFGDAALGVLADALKHPESDIRLHAIWALTRIRKTNVLPLLAGMLKDPDRLVVKQVIQSMGGLKDARAIAVLTSIADDRSDRELSKLAREAIKTLQGQ
jgi:HEAT repeat protein